ncbi:MAG: carboxylesterase family protein [Variovorax sp.]|nr:carboxylesterase family protein [Variovorax sp.]
MVWLHGGAFIHGNGNEPFFNAAEFPSHGVVLVNVNMRVGPIGLLAHPLLCEESDHGVSGNYMLLDIISALQWVRDNIERFGGNPDNVTNFGESGGGGKVLSMMCSGKASGLFHKAIIQSGGVLGTLNGRPSAENEALGHAMFEKLGVSNAGDPLAAARALPWKAIIDADGALVEERSLTITRWNSTIDGWLLTDSTAELIRSGSAPNWLPLIAGCSLGEIDGTGVPYITYPSLVEANRNAALSAKGAGHPSYVYVFDRVPPGWRKDGCVSFHRLEPGYIFGDWDDRNGFFTNDAISLARASGAKQVAPELNDGDRRVSQAMMQLWTSFARSGTPRSDSTLRGPYTAKPTNTSSSWILSKSARASADWSTRECRRHEGDRSARRFRLGGVIRQPAQGGRGSCQVPSLGRHR